MAITAKLVNELRKKTGAGMMDCKTALVEAEGDMEAAIDNLRKKGQKIAAKRGDREASEGLVIAKITADGTKGIVLTLNCETDFVAKNADFIDFANKVADIAIETGVTTAEELLTKQYDAAFTIGDKIVEQTGVIGEKIEIKTLEVIEAPSVVAYNHPGNQIASLVGLTKKAEEEGKQVAMQVAAMAPIALDEASVSQETIDREIEVGKELAIAEGKPADMAEQIAKGRLTKFFKETTLLNQAFVRDNKVSVKQFLHDVDKDLTVTDFKRVSLSI